MSDTPASLDNKRCALHNRQSLFLPSHSRIQNFRICKTACRFQRMPVSNDYIWRNFGACSKSKWPKQTTVYCLHCGVTVTSNQESMAHHLSQCKSYLHYCEISHQNNELENINSKDSMNMESKSDRSVFFQC